VLDSLWSPISARKHDVPGSDIVGQPNAIVALVECMTISVHATRLNDQDHRFAASAANSRGCCRVLRQMNMVPLPFHQALIPDRREEPLDGSMVEVLGRLNWFQTEVNLDTMALIGSNTIAHDGIASLQISLDDLHQVLAMQCPSMAFHRVQQIVNIDPATVIEPDPDQLGPVPEQEAEEFARSFLVIGTHESTSLFLPFASEARCEHEPGRQPRGLAGWGQAHIGSFGKLTIIMSKVGHVGDTCGKD
jgi:hypothetical protein